jgi:peptide/nickel transport system substrate-binding protein
MLSRYSRLKLRRKFRARKKAIQASADNANKQLERHIFRRQHNWKTANRFVAGWIGLMVILGFAVTLQYRGLGATYLTVQPTSGGIYSEGIIGNLNNANPIYATSPVDNAVASLVFSGLFNYDQQNNLVGDLANSWVADDTAKKYTITLKDNIYWHDGEKFNADDVVFTYKIIQNPDTQSSYFTTWRRIEVKKIDDLTVEFNLPNSYSPFPYLLTNGILPEHKLASIEPVKLRSNDFNNSPIGTGPFKWQEVNVDSNGSVKSETVQLIKNENYFKGAVQLSGFSIKSFPDTKSIETSLSNKDIIGAANTSYLTDNGKNIDSLLFNQTSALMLFMNTQNDLTKEINIRKALIKATDTKAISAILPYPVIPVDEPILRGQLGYNKAYAQLPFAPEEVDKILTESGWSITDGQQYRQKDGKDLVIKLVSENNPDYAKFSQDIQNQWAKFGIKTEVLLADKQEINSTILESKEYDVFLYPISIGADPDVYVYWHSSQVDKSNLSKYKSNIADSALEAGRSRSDLALRSAKYEPFLKAWQADVPAIGLHQPVFIYSTSVKVYNLEPRTINVPSDRYYNVHNWQINTKKATQN